MACNYNQNQSCTNLCCTGKDCLQHPQNRIKIFYESIMHLYPTAPEDAYEDGQNNCKGRIISMIEHAFPEVLE